MKTLIVEDDPTSRLLLQEYMRGYGEVDAVGNGRLAVQAVRARLARQDRYDLICLDIMMPEMDGHHALEVIRELERAAYGPSGDRAKVIMTTALSDIKNVAAAYNALCDAYLTKPVRRDQLEAAIQELGLLATCRSVTG